MKIALIRLSALGDIIQSSIVLQFVKKNYPKAQIDWFVDERFKEILAPHSLISTLYALPLKDRKILATLKILTKARRNDYDLVIDLQGLLKSAVIARILSSKAYGFDKKSLKENLASYFYAHKKNIAYDENIILRNLYLLHFALKQEFNKDEILAKSPCFKADEKLKEKLIKKLKIDENKQNILIHLGSSMENKNYPKERFAILCQMILTRFKRARIFLCWGSAKEKKSAQFVLNDVASPKLSLLPKLNLQELIAMSALSTLIIGNDSGPTHLAFAMNKPSITIFGATPSYRNAYETPINKVVDSGKFIADTKHIDRNDFCIQNVDEGQIFTYVKVLLDENR